MSVGSRELISPEADAQWIREREAASEAGVRRALPDTKDNSKNPEA
jgi:hypothetical protein